MASESELVDLARQIAAGFRSNARGEWMRWIDYYSLKRGNLTAALEWAEQLGADIAVREEMQGKYRDIARAVGRYKREIERLSFAEQRKLFGYVRWWLTVGT